MGVMGRMGQWQGGLRVILARRDRSCLRGSVWFCGVWRSEGELGRLVPVPERGIGGLRS